MTDTAELALDTDRARILEVCEGLRDDARLLSRIVEVEPLDSEVGRSLFLLSSRLGERAGRLEECALNS